MDFRGISLTSDGEWSMRVAWMGCGDLGVREGAETRVFIRLGDNGINLLSKVRKGADLEEKIGLLY